MTGQDLYTAFNEWEGRVPRDGSLFIRRPGPCPVCGAPLSSCSEGGHVMAVKRVKKPARRPVPVEEIQVPEHLQVETDDDEDLEVVEPEAADVEDEDQDTESDEDAADVNVEKVVGDNQADAEATSDTEQSEAPAFYPGAPRNSVVIGPDDPVKVHGVRIGNEIHLTKQTVRAVMPARASRWSYILLHHVGSVVHVENVDSYEED